MNQAIRTDKNFLVVLNGDEDSKELSELSKLSFICPDCGVAVSLCAKERNRRNPYFAARFSISHDKECQLQFISAGTKKVKSDDFDPNEFYQKLLNKPQKKE